MTHTPVVIITGASRGIGAATALWLANAGSAVTLIARSAAALESVSDDVQKRGGSALALEADMNDNVHIILRLFLLISIINFKC